ncbi:MAG: uracil-DNA glycosylase [Verrucomicrobia bacterium]|nr:uracil-DNA glycosylase [Verrucomicrobiota bacterium]
MSAYAQLLDAAIRDLEGRKECGERFVVVAPDSLSALAAPRSQRREQAEAVSQPRLPAAAPRPVQTVAPSSLRVQPLATVPTPEKSAAFAELRSRVMACVKCPHLVASRQSVVFGAGDLNAQLMFVGEAPGADEDRLGEPFVGAAGQLLTKIISAMGQTRQAVFIANVLKCRPNQPPGEPGNRKPHHDEMATCLPYLREQIQLVQPRVIVALGGTAVEGLFSMSDAGITRRRGSWMDFLGTPVMPTFHPSYLLRAEAGADQGRALKRQVWEDMLQVMERLGLPISERQRDYFK